MKTKQKFWVCAAVMFLLIAICPSVMAGEIANNAKGNLNVTYENDEEVEWEVIWQDEIRTATVEYGEPKGVWFLVKRGLLKVKDFVVRHFTRPSPIGDVIRRGTLRDGREVVLDVGDGDSGWTHIVRRNHHNELMNKFGLRDNDNAVKDFIIDNVGKGPCVDVDAPEKQKCKVVIPKNGKNLIIIVSKNRLRVITAYPG